MVDFVRPGMKSREGPQLMQLTLDPAASLGDQLPAHAFGVGDILSVEATVQVRSDLTKSSYQHE